MSLTRRLPEEPNPAAKPLRDAITEPTGIGSVIVDLGPDHGHRIVATMRASSVILGALILSTENTGTHVRRNLERAALVMALHYTNARAVDEAEIRLRGDLLYDLLTRPPGNQHEIDRHAYRLSLDLTQRYIVVCAAMDSVARRRTMLDMASLAAAKGGVAGEGGGSIILAIPGSDPDSAVSLVAERLKATPSAKATIGGAVANPGLDALHNAYKEALQCQSLLVALGRQGESGTIASIGAIGLLFSSASTSQIDDFIDSALGAVLRYDAKHNTQIFRTLRAYLAAGGHLAQTAESEHIHVNTLYGRLQRLSKILGDDWREPESQMNLQLAIVLWQLRVAPENLGRGRF